MTWVLIVGLAWLAVAAVAALAIARAIHVADEKQRRSADVFVFVEDDPHVPLRSTDELAVAAGDGAVPPPRTAADGGSPRLRGRRNVVRNPVASSERTPHTHKSGAL